MDPAEYQMLLAALWKKFDAIRRNNPSKAYERKWSGFRVMDEDRKAYVRWAYEDLGLKPPKEAAPRKKNAPSVKSVAGRPRSWCGASEPMPLSRRDQVTCSTASRGGTLLAGDSEKVGSEPVYLSE